MIIPWFSLAAPSAVAHQPHDVVDFVDVSAGFASDGVVIASRYPNQNWRSIEVSLSTDGGVNWTAALRGLQYRSSLSDLRLSPAFPTDGLGLVSTRGDGAWLTSDGAATWRQVLGDDKILLAGVVALDDGGPILLVAEATVGVLRSDDLGESWVPVGGPRVAEAMAAFGDDVAVSGDGSVFHSTDAGATFVETSLLTRTYDVAVADGAVAVAIDGGVLLSALGAPFDLLDAFPGEIRAVGLSPGWPADRTIFAAEQLDGIYVSEDGGQTVGRYDIGIGLSDQSQEHFYSFRFSGSYPTDGTVFANMYEGLLVSRDFGRTWSESDTRPPGVINALDVSPNFPFDGVVLVASYDAGMWISSDGGDTFQIQNDDLHNASIYDVDLGWDVDGTVVSLLALNGHVLWGHEPDYTWEYDDLPPGVTYSSRAALSPFYAADGVALVGMREEGVYRTEDRGVTWTAVTGPLEAVSAVSWSLDGNVVLLGQKTGEVRRSTDGGRTFVPSPGIALGGEPAWIDSGPLGFLVGTGLGLFQSVDGETFDPVAEVDGIVHQVIVAADGTRFAAIRGGAFYRSEDGGAFVAVGAGLTDISSPYEYATSPDFAADGTMFASIDAKLFRSRDRGETWEQVGMAVIRYEEDVQAMVPPVPQIERERASSRGTSILEPGAWLELQFTGDGVAFLGATGPGLGNAEISIDGAVAGELSQTGLEAWQVEQFRREDLTHGIHTIRVSATGILPVEVDAIDVYVPLPTPPVDLAEREPDESGCRCTAAPVAAGWLGYPLLAAALARRRANRQYRRTSTERTRPAAVERKETGEECGHRIPRGGGARAATAAVLVDVPVGVVVDLVVAFFGRRRIVVVVPARDVIVRALVASRVARLRRIGIGRVAGAPQVQERRPSSASGLSYFGAPTMRSSYPSPSTVTRGRHRNPEVRTRLVRRDDECRRRLQPRRGSQVEGHLAPVENGVVVAVRTDDDVIVPSPFTSPAEDTDAPNHASSWFDSTSHVGSTPSPAADPR